MRTMYLPGLLLTASMFGCAAAPKAAATAEPGPEVAVASAAPIEPGANGEIAGAKKAEATKKPAASLANDDADEPFGEGGLGLTGIGEGGGGVGQGVSIGNVGGLGHGTGTGSGYGSAGGRGGSSGPHGKVAAATATTSGAGLPSEVIQRIIRQHLTKIRYCYEKAMAKDPNLAGKVAVKFTIGSDGAVSNASAGDTNIADAEMVTCVIGAVKGMSFPAPEGGVVQVTYPFQFSSDN